MDIKTNTKYALLDIYIYMDKTFLYKVYLFQVGLYLIFRHDIVFTVYTIYNK